ncbi:DNA polymerase delta catalytic subunit-like protein, partial [Trifolium pratense]
MNKNNSRKRSAPPPQPPPPKTKQALSLEEEFVDEDVFIDETLLSEDEESAILRDIEQRQALAARLAKWTRPPLSQEYLSQSRSILFQQLEIDYVIGESDRELLPNRSGPAAIIRIFGVTKE